jgi:hypothetical protein
MLGIWQKNECGMVCEKKLYHENKFRRLLIPNTTTRQAEKLIIIGLDSIFC